MTTSDVELPGLGRLVWSDEHQMFEGRLRAPTGEVELSLEVTDEHTLAKQVEHALRVGKGLAELEQRAKAFVVKEMLSIKNEGWLEEGEQPLSAAEFSARIRLGRVDILDGGAATLIFDDGDVFWGHYITVDLEPDGTLVNAGMFG